MAWTAPMTATTNQTLTAAQWNAQVRDNLLETMPAKATVDGSYFLANGANSLVQRKSAEATLTGLQTTTSTTYTDLTTAGPAVTATTGTRALVWITALMSNTSANAFTHASFAVSGATTTAANDQWSIRSNGLHATGYFRCTSATVIPLTAGSNTFTMKYRVGSGTGRFDHRHIIVMPL